MFCKARVFCKFNLWLKPKLCLSIAREDMDVHSLLFVRVYFESIFALALEDGTHLQTPFVGKYT